MPKKWAEVETSPQYQALAPDKQQAAKQQYFDTVVAPQVPQESLPTAKSQFFGQADVSPAQAWAAQKAPDSAGSSIVQGATLGFGDELLGGMAAVDTGLSNLFSHVKGEKPKFSMGEAYDAMRDQVRMNASPARFQQENPGGNQTGLELMGGLMSGGKAGGEVIKGGETMISRLGRSALTGAGFGGAAGVGSGEGVVDRAKKGAEGLGVGAAIGLVPGVAGELVAPGKRAAGYAARAFRSAFQSMSGKSPEEAMKAMHPEELKKYQDMAVDYVKNLIHESGGKVENLTEDAAHKMGKPVTGAEAIGRQGINQLASVGRRPGATGDAAETQFRIRGDERSERLQENLAKAASVDVAHTQGHMEQLNEDLIQKNHPRYEAAFAQPPPSMTDPKLQDLLKQRNVQEGLRTAQEVASNKGYHLDLRHDPITGKWEGNPSWQDLDIIKKSMDSNISRKHTNGVGKFISDFQSNADVGGARKFRDWMFEANPKYKDAVAHGGETIGLRNAYDAAPKIMSNTTSEHAFDKHINDLSPAELEATKSGFVNDAYTKLQSGKFKEKDLKQPVFMAKARRLLGESQARQFVGEIEQEMRLKANEQRIPPGRQSITGELKHAGEAMDQQTDDMIHGFIDNGIRRGIPTAIMRTANNVLFDIFRAARTPEQKALRDEVGKLLLMKPDELRATLEGPVAGSPKSAFRPSLSPKAKEYGKMILHLSTGPIASTAVQETNQ